MPIPFGAKNNRGVFHKDKLTRKLPPTVAKRQRYQELVITVWTNKIKTKTGQLGHRASSWAARPRSQLCCPAEYRVAIITEDGVYLLEPYKKLPRPLLFSDLVYPIRHAGRAMFIKDPEAAPRSAHIILLRSDAVRPKCE